MKKYSMGGPKKTANTMDSKQSKLKPMDPRTTAVPPSGERAPRPEVQQQGRCMDGMAKHGKK